MRYKTPFARESRGMSFDFNEAYKLTMKELPIVYVSERRHPEQQRAVIRKFGRTMGDVNQ